jgi:hypothetical protein
MTDRPALFTQIRQPTQQYLALPEVSSANRRILPGCILDAGRHRRNKLIIYPGCKSLAVRCSPIKYVHGLSAR